jgi:hypothetical protein
LFFKKIKKIFKIVHSVTIVIVSVAIVALCYLVHPLFIEPSPTVPGTYSVDDNISWTFFRSPGNPQVYQKFSLFQDGRNEVEITRKLGDFDIDMLGPVVSWSPVIDKEISVIKFKKRDIITREEGKRLFRKAIASGVIDITDEAASKGGRLLIGIKVGWNDRSVSGPELVLSPVAYPPGKWKNRIYWQKLSTLIDHDSKLGPLMAKLTYLKSQ